MRRHFWVAWLWACMLVFTAHTKGATVEAVAGGGQSDADEVQALDAKLNEPFAVAFDDAGNMYIAEMVGGRILRVDGDGKLTRLAGRTEPGDAGDGGPASEAVFNGMHHILMGPNRGILIADTWNHRIRRLDLKAMTVRHFAGTGRKEFSGDGGPALSASFGDVYCLAWNPNKTTLYVDDLDHLRIRAIAQSPGIVHTVAGNGEKGIPADGSLATEAPLVDPRAVAVDSEGQIYILERSGHALRVVDALRIHTVAGTGKAGPAVDDADALSCTFNGPKHLCVDGSDDVYIADTENHVIRKYLPRERRMIRLVGSGRQGDSGVGGDPLSVELNRPHGVTIGPDKHLYIADSSNHRILKVVP
jgi:sugar lactone lactonase YvrE